jgi:hypothetical protein
METVAAEVEAVYRETAGPNRRQRDVTCEFCWPSTASPPIRGAALSCTPCDWARGADWRGHEAAVLTRAENAAGVPAFQRDEYDGVTVYRLGYALDATDNPIRDELRPSHRR